MTLTLHSALQPGADSVTAQSSEQALAECRAVLERHAKSFALAAKLLPRDARDAAAALYAYCRRVDDAIDEAPAGDQPRALAQLKAELDTIYAGSSLRGADRRAFQALVALRQIPRLYPDELLAGMASDVAGQRYETLPELLQYCHRVAAVVGLMMCHVLTLTRDSALTCAAQLGLAMQLTNICRDVAEDLTLGRLYLPRSLLAAEGVPPQLWTDVAASAETLALPSVRRVIEQLLDEADRYYRAAEPGIAALPFRAGLAIRAAAKLYAAIGSTLRRRGCDPTLGRAVVSRPRKLALLALACCEHIARLPWFVWERVRTRGKAQMPRAVLTFPGELLDQASELRSQEAAE